MVSHIDKGDELNAREITQRPMIQIDFQLATRENLL